MQILILIKEVNLWEITKTNFSVAFPPKSKSEPSKGVPLLKAWMLTKVCITFRTLKKKLVLVCFRFPPAFQVHAQTLHLLPLSARRPKCFPTKRVLAIKIRPGVLRGLAPKFSLSVSNGDILGKASYNRDKFILLATSFSKEMVKK